LATRKDGVEGAWGFPLSAGPLWPASHYTPALWASCRRPTPAHSWTLRAPQQMCPPFTIEGVCAWDSSPWPAAWRGGGGAAHGVAAPGQQPGAVVMVAAAAAGRTADDSGLPPPQVKHPAMPAVRMIAARLAALEAVGQALGLQPLAPAAAAEAAAAAAAAAGIPSTGVGTKSQHRWACLAIRAAALGRRWPYHVPPPVNSTNIRRCGQGRQLCVLRVVLRSRSAQVARQACRCLGTGWRISGIGSFGRRS
jgi:hypothetical protein